MPSQRTNLSPEEAAAAIALTAAQIDGVVINAKSFRRRTGGDTVWRVEVEVGAGRVPALLDALDETEPVRCATGSRQQQRVQSPQLPETS